jgi:hypothetical protein
MFLKPKVHMMDHFNKTGVVCSSKGSIYYPHNKTDDWEKVDCKNCLAFLRTETKPSKSQAFSPWRPLP